MSVHVGHVHEDPADGLDALLMGGGCGLVEVLTFGGGCLAPGRELEG